MTLECQQIYISLKLYKIKFVSTKLAIEKVREFLGLTPNVLALCLFYPLGIFVTYTWFNFLPLYLESLGAGVIEIGTAYMIAFATYAIAQTPGGYLADRYGRKKIIVLGIFVSAFLFPILAIATTWLMAAIVLATLLVVEAIYTPAVYSIIPESVPENQRGTAYGSFWLFKGVSFTLAPLVGGVVIQLYGYNPLFHLTAMVSLLLSILFHVFLRETSRKEDGLKTKTKSSPLLHLRGSLLLYFVSACISFFGVGLAREYFALYAERQFLMTETDIGLMFSASSLFMLIMSVPAGKIIDKIGRRLSIALGGLISTGASVIWLYSPNNLFAIILYGISGAVIFSIIASDTLIADLTVKETRASIMGLFTTTMWILNSVASPLGSVLWTVLDPKIPFIIGFFFKIPAIVLLYFVKEKPLKT